MECIGRLPSEKTVFTAISQDMNDADFEAVFHAGPAF
jgi:hypothetical protein